MDRRDFLKITALSALILNAGKLFPFKRIFDDETDLVKKFISGLDYSMQSESLPDIIKYVGEKLTGTPYEAGTLDVNKDEKLVIHFSGFDCVTFVENVLAITKMIRADEHDIRDYSAELMDIRYRNGKIEDYTSRLNYFSDWIYDNENKGIVKNITKEIGGERYDKELNFMTTHKDAYAPLKNNPELVKKMKSIEDDLNTREMYYIKKGKINEYYSELQTGDIFALTTEIKGLDVTHTGYIYMKGSTAHIMHESQAAGEVIVSSNSLKEYLSSIKKSTGVMIARPV